MSEFQDNILNYLRQQISTPLCLNCHSVFLKEHLFCDECYQELIAPLCGLKKRIINGQQTHYYLIDWIPNESNLISNLVYRLKNKKSPLAWRFFAKLIYNELFKQNFKNNYDLVIPLPGSTNCSKHSYIFALYIAEYLRTQYCDVLIKDINDNQKSKTLIERSALSNQQISLKKNELFTKEQFDTANILYVDDILTTGETYKQSCAAIENSKSTTVFTLFYRRKIHET